MTFSGFKFPETEGVVKRLRLKSSAWWGRGSHVWYAMEILERERQTDRQKPQALYRRAPTTQVVTVRSAVE